MTQRCVAFVFARGGSKGVKNKNLRLIAGKPLLAHTVLQARASGLFDDIALSSDSDEILRTAAEYGVARLIKRPADLATDTAPKLPVIRHCVEEAERLAGTQYDLVVDLDATSPLRLPEMLGWNRSSCS